MKTIFCCLLALFASVAASGQTSVLTGSGAPTSVCTTGQVVYRDWASGNFYDCVNNAWHLTTFNLGNVQNVDTTNPANITQDSTHRFATDAEKSTWSGKQDALPSVGGNALKVLRVNAGATAYELVTLAGGGDMLKSENLSGLADNATARTNLGVSTVGNTGAYNDLTGKPTLGNSSSLNVGTTAGTVAAGDDSRVVGAVPNTRTVNGQALSGNVTLTTADLADSANKRFVTDAQQTVLGNTSGVNSGNQTITLTGDVTGSGTGSFATAIKPSVSLTTPNINAATGTSLAVTGAITSSGGGIGYASGAGGTVTQATSKATGVTLSKQAGEITMNGAALAAATIVSFTLTNTQIAATDVLILNHVTTGTRGAYGLNAQCASGSAVIYVRNNTAGSLGEAIVIRFAVVKAVTN